MKPGDAWWETLSTATDERAAVIRKALRYAEGLIEHGWDGEALLLAICGRFYYEHLTLDEAHGAASMANYQLLLNRGGWR